jgi:hypothetical protein
MPSLLGTYVTANYGRMTSQDTYGGVTYSNFGTRNLAFIKVIVSTNYAVDLTLGTGANATDTTASTYADPLSYFSAAVRTLQQFGEVYFVGTPVTSGTIGSGGTSGFVAAIAIDTMADENSGNTEVLSYPTFTSAFGTLQTQLANVFATTVTLNANGSSTVSVASNLPTVTITQLSAGTTIGQIS